MKKYRNFKETFFGRALIWAATYLVLLFQVMPALALPQGATVANGDATVERNGNQMVINQTSDRAIIYYSSFDIANGEGVRFAQPGSDAAVLNRVNGAGSSTIAGQMSANGRVFLINPNGILFTASAQVDVGALVASALNLSDGDFLSGKLNFSGGGGSVVNEGTLNGGFVYLVGGTVENRGTINASDVILAAGSSVVIDRALEGEIRVTIDGEDASVGDLASGSASDAVSSDTNATTGAGANAELANAMNQTTTPQQSSTWAYGTVVNEGTINVSGDEGGTVQVQGTQVGQFGTINADGLVGDGGKITLHASDVVVLSADSVTRANAGLNGNGGEIYIVGENAATIATGARIEAKGGSISGNGGFVETSGKRSFQIGSVPDVSASHGQGGTWLIDPANVVITNGGGIVNIHTNVSPFFRSTNDLAFLDVNSIYAALTNGVNVQVITGTNGTENGDIRWVSGANLNYGGPSNVTLTLNAINDISLYSTISNTTGGPLNLVLNANTNAITATSGSSTGSIFIAASINVKGAFNSSGFAFSNSAGVSATNITLNHTGSITLGSDLHAGAGNITLKTSGGAINQTAGKVTSGTLSAYAASNINLSTSVGTLNATNQFGNITINETSDIILGAVRANSGNVSVTNQTGDLTANSVSAGSNVWLTAVTGNIFITTQVVATNTAGSSVTLTSSGTITGGTVYAGTLNAYAASNINLSTSVGTLNATNRFENIEIDQTGAIILGTIRANTGNVSVTNQSGDITANSVFARSNVWLTAVTGNIFITNAVVATNTADSTVTLTSGGAITGGLVSASTLNAYAASNINLRTSVGTLNATNQFGNITINESNAITLGDVRAATGNVAVSNQTGDITANSVSAGSNVWLTAVTGNIFITNAVVATNTADSTVTLTAGNAMTGGLVSASTLNAWATNAINLSTAVGTLTATSRVGNITINEFNAITLGAVRATNGNVSVTNQSGDITANSAIARSNVWLTAVTGNIFITNQVVATNVTLTAGSAITGGLVRATMLNVWATNGINLSTDVGTLTATSEVGAITINEANAITLGNVQAKDSITVLAGGSLTALVVKALNGNIGLTNTVGNMVVSNLTASTQLSLSSAGAITQRPGGVMTATNFEFNASNDVSLTGNNDIQTVAGRSVAGSLTLKAANSNNLTVGIVGVHTGLVANGNLSVTQTVGFIRIEQQVRSTHSNIVIVATNDMVVVAGANAQITSGDLSSSSNGNKDVDSGVIFVSGAGLGDNLNAQGGHKITLSGAGTNAPLDFYVTNAQTLVNFTLRAPRDIIVGATVASLSSDITLIADKYQIGTGGVWVLPSGSLTSIGNLTISGSHLVTTNSAYGGYTNSGNYSVLIEGCIQANSNVTIESSSWATQGVDNVVISTNVTSESGSISVDADHSVLFTGGKLQANGGSITLNAHKGDVTIQGLIDPTAVSLLASNGNVNVSNTVTASDAITVYAGTNVNVYLSGSLNVTNSGGTNAITAINGIITLEGNVNAIGGLLSMTAGSNITQTTGVVTGETANLSAGGNITLDNVANDFGGAVSVVGDNVALTDANDIDLGVSTVSGTLAVTALGAGNITQSGALAVTGATTLTAAGDDITLNNVANDFGGAVSVVGDNVALTDANDIDLGASTVSGTLAVTALGAGNITQSGALAVTGATTLTAAGDDITLNNVANDFGGAVSVVGDNVALTDANDIDLGVSTVSGTLAVTALGAGNITQSGALAVTGATTLTAAGDDITLNNVANDFGGAVSVVGDNVALTDANDIDLGVSTVSGTLAVTALGAGNITQSGALAVTGATTLTAAGDDITLNNVANDFGGAVSVVGDNVALTDANDIDLGVSTVSGTLAVTALGAGNITQSGALAVTGATTLTAAGDDITLNNVANDFGGAVSVVGDNVALTDANDIDLGVSTVSGTLAVTALGAGNITQSGALAVTGATTLTAAGDDITLNNVANDFGGAVSVVGDNVALTDANDIDLGASTVSGTLAVTALGAGNITQSGALAVTGATTLTAAGDDITLNNVANDFGGAVSVVGDNVALTDANDIDLGVSTVSGTLAVTALGAGNITQSGALAVTGATTLTAAGDDITLNNVANDFGGAVSVVGDNVALTDANDIDLGVSTVSGTLAVTALGAGNITQSGALAVTGATTLTAAGDDITLNNVANDFGGAVSVVGDNVALTDANDIDLGVSTVSGTLAVTALGAGNITQSGALAVTGATTLDAGGNITLANVANDFVGAVTVVQGGAVTIKDVNALTVGGGSGSLDAEALGGDLTLAGYTTTGALAGKASGSITQTLAVTVGTTTTLDAGGNITLDNVLNDFQGQVNATGVKVKLVDANDIVLGNVTAGDTLAVTAGGADGDITQSGGPDKVVVTNATTLTAVGTGDITLANAANDFQGAVNADGVNVTLVDANSIQLGEVAATGTLGVEAKGGNITQTVADKVVAGGATTLKATANITLENVSNDFVSVTGTAGGSISLNDVDDVILTSLTTTDGSVTVTAGGTIKADYVAANGAASNAKLTNSSGDIVIGEITAGSNVCILSAGSVEITNLTGNITANNGSVAIWAKGSDINQKVGTIRSVNGNVYLAATNDINQSLGTTIKTDAGSIALHAHRWLNLDGSINSASSLLLSAADILVNGPLTAGDTLGIEATAGSITGIGTLAAPSIALRAMDSIGVSPSARLHVNAGNLATKTTTGSVYIEEMDSVVSASIAVPSVTNMIPACAAGMPVPIMSPVEYITSAQVLDLVVGGELSGNKINSGGNMVIKVDGSTRINSINAGGDFKLTGGGEFTFVDLTAGGTILADVGGGIGMGRVKAGSAVFTAGGSVNDNNSLVDVGTITIKAGGDVGSVGAPIKLSVTRIEDISGGNIYLYQGEVGNLLVNTINAGRGFVSLAVPNGNILDADNDGGMRDNAKINITAGNARLDAQQIGERRNPLDVNIPGTLTIVNSVTGPDRGDGFVWAHIWNMAKGEAAIDYKFNVPGLVIQNNQVVGGQDGVMREIFRTEAFFVETPELKSKQGVFGSPYFLHSFLNISEPVALGLIDYVLYGQAQVNVDPVMPPEAKKTINKSSGGTIKLPTPVEAFKQSAKGDVKPAPLKNGLTSL